MSNKTIIVVRDPDPSSQNKYEIEARLIERVEYVPYSIPPSIQRSYVVESAEPVQQGDAAVTLTSGQPRKAVDDAVAVFARAFIAHIANFVKAKN